MSSGKGKNVSDFSNTGVDQINHGISNVSLNSAQEDGWEVYARKSKNRAGSSAAKPWPSQNSNHKAWGHAEGVQKLGMRGNDVSGKASGNSWPTSPADSRRPAGRGNVRSQNPGRGSDRNAPAVAIRPPLEHGWKWNTKPSNQSYADSLGVKDTGQNPQPFDAESVDAKFVEEVNDDSDALDDTDDELLSDDFDSDASEKSHESRKKNRWFKVFFESFNNLTVEQINEPERQWHCPACQNGPGSIDWFRGLQPLITHAKTKGSKRVSLHREFAEILEEEVLRNGASLVPAGEAFGQWKGLRKEVKDKEIVWPPVVIIKNTWLEKDENDKWIGMGNQELLDYFSSYDAVKARHSYGPQGHRGMSVLIFEASPVGYLEAERLSSHFEEQGTNRDAWDRIRAPFYPGGVRQLYGYMAEKRDLDLFNQHSQGKSRLKFEMRSYQETVVSQLRQMSEDNQQLLWFKNKVAKEQQKSKTLEESFGVVTEKLRQTLEENRIVKLRTKMHHEQNKEEMDYQEQFFKDQIQMIHEARNANEDDFEKMQQVEREKVKQSSSRSSSMDDYRRRADEVAKFIKFQDKEMEDFVEARENLIKVHEEKMAAMKRRHWEEEVELEKGFNADLNLLMEKYSPQQSEERSSQSVM